MISLDERPETKDTMNLPAKTSKLLALQTAAERELHSRFRDIFNRHMALAFIHRQDHVFNERWTPELAAAGYEFSGYEVRDQQVVLHGVEVSAGFHYKINISFPITLVDMPAEIAAHFETQHASAKKEMRSAGQNPAVASSASAS
jgi:hypothetical protein